MGNDRISMFYIRADGNNHIGAGHIMRMLSLAEELKKLTELKFLTKDKMSKTLIEERNCEYAELSSDIPAFSIKEAEEICTLYGSCSISKPGLLIDSYLVSDEYLMLLKKYFVVICMDDTAEKMINADAIVNYNLYADEAVYKSLYDKNDNDSKLPKLLLGKDYMPVRKEFLKKQITVEAEVKSILVTVGGADEHDITGVILKEIKKSRCFEGILFHVVCGAYNENYERLLNKYSEEKAFIFHKNVKDMSSLMLECDAAVSAGGTTLNELAVMGMPFVCFALADNQIPGCKALGERKAALFAGSIDMKSPDADIQKKQLARDITEALEKMSGSVKMRLSLSENAKKTISRNGAENLAKALVVM